MSLQYSMIIQWSDEDQVYIATLPEFGPYASTHGSSYEEAARMGQEVLQLLVETREKEGQILPEPMKYGSSVSVPND
jgi:predicted RNase H-like HicB family nuclease